MNEHKARNFWGTGILTGFPSSCISLGDTFRTDLLLVDDALPGKPCPFGARDSHPTMLLLLPGSAIELGPQDFTALLLPKHYAHLPRTSLHLRVWSIGGRLEPRSFSGPPSSAGELLRTL